MSEKKINDNFDYILFFFFWILFICVTCLISTGVEGSAFGCGLELEAIALPKLRAYNLSYLHFEKKKIKLF